MIEKLRFDCQVEDGDLGFLSRTPGLRFCLYNNAKNFNVTASHMQKRLTGRGHDQDAPRDSLSRFPIPSEFIGD